MRITDIPFVSHVGIKEDKESLSLNINDKLINHIKTIHAGAQFTLAETQSGLYLQKLFPELIDKAVPLLRDAKIKYKRPAIEQIFAFASVNEEAVKTLKAQFDKKGRGSIQIDVDIKDIDGNLSTQASFTWFIQSLH